MLDGPLPKQWCPEMEQQLTGTKLALIMAAGELFAEHGLEGTGIRAIAEKAQANTAAVNYHFGSKENLYKEVLLYATQQGAGVRVAKLLNDERFPATPQGVANAIRQIVRDWFTDHFLAEKPPWRTRLFMRSMVEPAELLAPVVEGAFRPDTEALKTLLRRAKPDMSDDEAQLWAFGLIGQFTFYMLARSAVLMMLHRTEYDQAFLDAAADHVVRSTIAGLGLPAPH